MATTVRHLLPTSPSPKQIAAISATPSWISCNPFSEFPIASRLTRQLHQHQQGQFTASVAFNPSGNFDISKFNPEDDTPDISPPPPPSENRFEVIIDNDTISRLDLSPFHNATGITSPSSAEPKEFLERTIGFAINYKRADENDPRELCEYPDIRLWFVRLDAAYPWLPVLLDWRAGELARYAAMLVPHQMSVKMGVVFNPEAIELFTMNKAFIVYSWLKQHGIPKPRLKTIAMARMLGFGIGNELFDLIDEHHIDP